VGPNVMIELGPVQSSEINTTQYLHRHIIDAYLVARWADEFALELRGLAVEEWLRSLGRTRAANWKGRPWARSNK
jgi:hypothetical protein